MALSPFADCIRACPECPIAGLGNGAIEAVNEVTNEFDPQHGTRNADPRQDNYEDVMLGPVLEAAEQYGVSPEHAPAIMAAAQRVLTNECPEAIKFAAA